MPLAPTLCSQLWAKLDIVPISLKPDEYANDPAGKDQPFWNAKDIDEQADSMARKSIMYVCMTKKWKTRPTNFSSGFLVPSKVLCFKSGIVVWLRSMQDFDHTYAAFKITKPRVGMRHGRQ